MRGRKVGRYPTFQLFRDNVHWVLDLYDPFNLSKNMSQEKKDKRLIMEINNGRLAMIEIFGFLAADAVPGSVPALNSFVTSYEGNVMTPFSSDFSLFGAPVEAVTAVVAAVVEAAPEAAAVVDAIVE